MRASMIEVFSFNEDLSAADFLGDVFEVVDWCWTALKTNADFFETLEEGGGVTEVLVFVC